MEASSLSSFVSAVSPSNTLKMAKNCKIKTSTMICRSQKSGNHVNKCNGTSADVTTKSSSASSIISPDHGPKQMEITENLVLSPVHDEGIGIVKFLRGKTFFITGATGFFGKVLIEKILRAAPDVHKIYMLMKAKNKEAALERLKNEIMSDELFEHLKETHGKSYEGLMLTKLVPVVGNVCEISLGLDEDVAGFMAKEVDVIINSAANTTFDERYDTALDINTGGPTRLMSFAKQCLKLKLFLHVSTVYVNGERQGTIMEKPCHMASETTNQQQQHNFPKLSIENELKIVLDSKQEFEGKKGLRQKMKELGRQRAKKFGWQDTYVFTKAMGEMVIDDLRGDIPVVVIRPSAIESTYKEPFPGWIQGIRMMDPLILQYGMGKLPGFVFDPDAILDVVPADMVVNATLAAMAKHYYGPPEYNIYQVASSVVNPLVYSNLTDLFYQHFNSSPFIDPSSGIPVRVSQFKHFTSIHDLSSHLLNPLLADSCLDNETNLSKRLVARKSVERAKHLENIYQPYTFCVARFDNSNTKRLMEAMSNVERQQFEFEVEKIDWKDYIINVHIPGLRRYVMKKRGLSN